MFTKSLSLNPRNKNALSRRGMAYMLQHKFKEGMADYAEFSEVHQTIERQAFIQQVREAV